MQSFSRGWSFLQQAWSMAFKDKDLLKPSFYALIIGMVVSVIGIIPIIGAAFIFGTEGIIGRGILFVFGALLVFAQFIVSYIFSAMTVYLIFGYVSEGDGRMDKAWKIVQRDFFDIVTLAAVSTAVNLLKNAANRNRNRRGGIAAGLISSAAGVFEALWTEASYLVLPAMVIDDLNLKDGLAKIWKITKENLLLVGISTVGVRGVTGLIGFVLAVIGIVLGLGFFYVATAILGFGTFGLIVGIGIGVILGSIFFMLASVINSYTTTAYHTCLYIWARDVEKASVRQEQGIPVNVPAPAPLAAVLGTA
jgi:membrane-anchored glycerophosphoryl diester phosphodiesterase (GDPDase)